MRNRIILTAGTALLSLGIVFLAGVALWLNGLARTMPSANELRGMVAEAPAMPPESVVRAFLASEDVDFLKRAKASWRLSAEVCSFDCRLAQILVPTRRGRELARSTLVANVLAASIHKVLSPDEIIRLYLSRVNLGHGRFGVTSGAQYYFSKSIGRLDPKQAATLAALQDDPRHMDPLRSPGAVRAQRDLIIAVMDKQGWGDNQELTLAR